MEKKPTKKELLKMPWRESWSDTSREYDQVLLVPAGTKHDSGWMEIAIIGVYKEGEETKYEMCAQPDDIACHFPHIGLGSCPYYPYVRMDCWYPQGVLQYHGYGKFRVGPSLSSVDIYFTPNNQ